MSVLVKIDCACGQRYSFDVDPVNGRVPSTVICPACGADGTASANDFLAKCSHADIPMSSSSGPLRVALTRDSVKAAVGQRTAIRPASTQAGQVSRTQAQHEARAKMLWGDKPLQVLAYLLSQGFTREDASELVKEFLAERTRIIRWKGIKYVAIGIVLFLVPAITLAVAFFDNHIPNLRAVGVWVVIGLAGVSLLIKGIFILISPGSTSGDASDSSDMDSVLD